MSLKFLGINKPTLTSVHTAKTITTTKYGENGLRNFKKLQKIG